MKKKIILLTFILISFFLAPKNALAENIIDVYYNGKLLTGEAIFSFSDVKPGDLIEKDIKIDNVSTIPQLIKISCEEVENYKDLAKAMQMKIYENSTVLYEGSLYNFCNVDGKYPVFYDLSTIGSGASKTYKFSFYFPKESGNEYQKSKYVFNLYFDPRLPEGDHILINEVYYYPDKSHGVDIKNCCGEVKAEISGNGEGNKNIIKVKVQNQCLVVQQNTANIVNNITANSNTGGNSSNGQGGISTGFSKIIASIKNRLNYNFNFGACGSVIAQNDEWIELYNPTDNDVSLKNYTITDNSGNETKINANKTIKAKGFALLSKDAQTWQYWNEPDDTTIVELGKIIGDGLDNNGDRLILKDDNGATIDYMSYQNDTEIWNPSVPQVEDGHSLTRTPNGNDSDKPVDWYNIYPPTPGI